MLVFHFNVDDDEVVVFYLCALDQVLEHAEACNIIIINIVLVGESFSLNIAAEAFEKDLLPILRHCAHSSPRVVMSKKTTLSCYRDSAKLSSM